MNVFVLCESNDESKLNFITKNFIENIMTKNAISTKVTSLSPYQIKHCIGCFCCWIKSPGECCINDLGISIAKDYINSDLVIILTSIQFGSYSFTIKTALDRLIPNIMPFLKKVNGEIHHVKRYDNMPSIISIGVQTEVNKEEEETFINLVNRNALNFYPKEYSILTFNPLDSKDHIEKTVYSTINKYILKNEV